MFYFNNLSLKSLSVCSFIGTWNVGSTKPGKPYVAKWPDKYGNVKTRNVTRPEIIGTFFGNSNCIDVGNQLRQDVLALERHWLTKNPWFRIDCTVIGITVVDSFQAAKHQAPTCAKIDKMGVKDFAMFVAHGLIKRDMSKESKSVVLPSGGIATSTDQGVEVQQLALPKTLEEVMFEHRITKTDQRKGNCYGGLGQLVRRQCNIRAEGCEGQCTHECQHEVCKATVHRALNRFGPTQGLFVCQSYYCRLKHWKDIMSLANSTCTPCD